MVYTARLLLSAAETFAVQVRLQSVTIHFIQRGKLTSLLEVMVTERATKYTSFKVVDNRRLGVLQAGSFVWG